MTRRELREHIFNELFTSDFYLASEEDLMAQLDLYFTHAGGDGLEYSPQDIPEQEREEVKAKAMAVCEKRDEIDKILDSASVGWKTDRMSRADLAVLRLGVYELLFDENIPAGVAINEAVLLAKKFGGDESFSFVNGILGKVQRQAESGRQ